MNNFIPKFIKINHLEKEDETLPSVQNKMAGENGEVAVCNWQDLFAMPSMPSITPTGSALMGNFMFPAGAMPNMPMLPNTPGDNMQQNLQPQQHNQ